MFSWVIYQMPYYGKATQEHIEEREFRFRVLGPKHDVNISYDEDSITVSLHLRDEDAILFRLKFPAAVVDTDFNSAYNKLTNKPRW